MSYATRLTLGHCASEPRTAVSTSPWTSASSIYHSSVALLLTKLQSHTHQNRQSAAACLVADAARDLSQVLHFEFVPAREPEDNWAQVPAQRIFVLETCSVLSKRRTATKEERSRHSHLGSHPVLGHDGAQCNLPVVCALVSLHKSNQSRLLCLQTPASDSDSHTLRWARGWRVRAADCRMRVCTGAAVQKVHVWGLNPIRPTLPATHAWAAELHLHADGLHFGEDGESLPDVVVQTRFPQVADVYLVRLTVKRCNIFTSVSRAQLAATLQRAGFGMGIMQ